jgi:cell division protein FtsL
MIRVLNFFCIALMGLSILGLYDVSEKTRLARVAIGKTQQAIIDERGQISTLETDWARLSNPDRVATLARSKLGLDNSSAVQLSSFEQLPRNGEDSALSEAPLRNANAEAPAQ